MKIKTEHDRSGEGSHLEWPIMYDFNCNFMFFVLNCIERVDHSITIVIFRRFQKYSSQI